MNDHTSRNPLWYWGAVALLLLVGAGALQTSVQKPVAIRYEVPAGEYVEPSVEDMAREFRSFRKEMSTLSHAQQQQVWQSLRDRSESLSEQTLYTFFAMTEARKGELIDRTIDRIEWRRRLWRERSWASSFGDSTSRDWPVREVSNEASWDRSFAEMSIEERLALRRDMWEDATPQAYAMRIEFYRLVGQRRQERGLPEFFRRAG